MRNAGGYLTIISPTPGEVRLNSRGGPREEICEGLTERDSFSCSHCGRVMIVLPMMRPEDLGGLCRMCMKLVCDRCVGHGCTPLEKQLELAERKGIALRSYGL